MAHTAFSLCVSFASLFSLLEGSANNFLTPVRVLLLLALPPSSFLLVVFYCRYWVNIHRKPDLKHPPLAFITTSHCSTWIRAELFCMRPDENWIRLLWGPCSPMQRAWQYQRSKTTLSKMLDPGASESWLRSPRCRRAAKNLLLHFLFELLGSLGSVVFGSCTLCM